MKELKGRLSKELLQDFNVKIMDSLEWSLPVHSIEIAYETVKRTKMDILMKMMLIAFQKAGIETAEELSDILLVEQLFIQDLIDKLTSARVIEKKEGTFALTGTGVQQLAAGIFDHEPENNTIKMLYSPCHQDFLHAELSDGLSEELEVYRYHHEVADWHITSLEQKGYAMHLKLKALRQTKAMPKLSFRKLNRLLTGKSIQCSVLNFIYIILKKMSCMRGCGIHCQNNGMKQSKYS